MGGPDRCTHVVSLHSPSHPFMHPLTTITHRNLPIDHRLFFARATARAFKDTEKQERCVHVCVCVCVCCRQRLRRLICWLVDWDVGHASMCSINRLINRTQTHTSTTNTQREGAPALVQAGQAHPQGHQPHRAAGCVRAYTCSCVWMENARRDDDCCHIPSTPTT